LTLFAGLALAACGGGATPTATSTAASTAGATPTTAATSGATATTGGGGGTADDISCDDGIVGSQVTIIDFEFQPSTIAADADNTVNWKNNAERTHTVTFDNGKDCGSLAGGDSLTVLFLAPGTYTYHCSIHSSMKGTVTVSG
jgi:plastocyanin